MSCAYKLRKYHDERMAKTNVKLFDALARMISGQTQNVSKVVWTKVCWAVEAGVNINTAVSKVDGAFLYADANALFEKARETQKKTASTLQAKIRQLQAENHMLKQEIAALHRSRTVGEM